MSSSRPKFFLIRGRNQETLLEPKDPNFDQSVETKVSFTQACNLFISMILIYESIKQFYYVFYYDGICSDYSVVMIYYMMANAFWVVISFIGAALIRSKQAKKILVFLILLVVTLLSRIGIYIIMYDAMNHYISEDTLQNCQCQAIYVDELYMIQAIVEALILLILIIFVKIIHKYIQSWEQQRAEFFFGSTPAVGSTVASRLLQNQMQ